MKRLYEKKDHLIKRNQNLTDEQKSEIIAVLNKYPNLEGNIDWNKSSSLTYEDFKLHILDNAGKSNSQAKKKGLAGLVEGEDYDILSSKNGETLYAVYSHLASKTLASNRVEPKIWTESTVMDWSAEDEFSGRKVYRNEEGELVELKPGAKWCISMNNPDYWNEYCLKGKLTFYFLFRKGKSLEDWEKKIAISVDSRNGKIVNYTLGDDTSTYYFLSDEYENLILDNLKKCTEKAKQNIRKGLVLNPQTNRYDYKGSITKGFLEAFNLLKVDESGNKVGFTIDFGEVTGSFNCSRFRLTSLKGAPQVVGGDFYCKENKLTSLEGAPQKVGEFFCCYDNKLTSLKGAPQEVGGDFDCTYTQLTSLEGAPKRVGGSFICSTNKLTSLKGAPQEINKSFNCSDNKLTSLEGAPETVVENFDCSWNQLTSLKGAPQEVGGSFNCSSNQLTSLEGAPERVGGSFNCSYNKLSSLEGAPEKVVENFYCSNNSDLSSLEGIGEVRGYIDKDF